MGVRRSRATAIPLLFAGVLQTTTSAQTLSNVSLAQPAAAQITSATVNLSTPEVTLGSFAAAISRGRWEDAACCVSGARASEAAGNLGPGFRIHASATRVTKIAVTPSGADPGGVDRVSVKYVPVIVAAPGDEGDPQPAETLTLRKTAAGWQIAPMDRDHFNARRANQKSVLVLVSFLLANPDEVSRQEPFSKETI